MGNLFVLHWFFFQASLITSPLSLASISISGLLADSGNRAEGGLRVLLSLQSQPCNTLVHPVQPSTISRHSLSSILTICRHALLHHLELLHPAVTSTGKSLCTHSLVHYTCCGALRSACATHSLDFSRGRHDESQHGTLPPQGYDRSP